MVVVAEPSPIMLIVSPSSSVTLRSPFKPVSSDTVRSLEIAALPVIETSVTPLSAVVIVKRVNVADPIVIVSKVFDVVISR